MATAGPRNTTEAIVASKVYASSAPTQLAQVVAGPNGESIGVPTTTTITSGNLTALNTTVVFDPSNYRMIYVNVYGTFTLTFTLETSQDGGATWVSYPYHVTTTFTTIWQTSNAGSGARFCEAWPAGNLQMRIRASAYTSGTANVTIMGSAAATFPTALNVISYAQGYQDHDAAITGQPLLQGAYASSTIQTGVSANGDIVRLWANRNGILFVKDAGSYNRITTATTTVVKSSAGTLGRVIINTATKALTGTVTIYDNTSAAGTIVGFLPAAYSGREQFDLHCTTGITVVTSAADDIVVTYI